MPQRWTDLPADILALLRRGTVIPAHLLALDAERRLDVRRQRALARYYLDAGAGVTSSFHRSSHGPKLEVATFDKWIFPQNETGPPIKTALY